MDTNRIPKQALQYRPKGRRNTGRPRKDQLHDDDDDDDDDDDEQQQHAAINTKHPGEV
jgi:hypothetical protein